MKTKFSILHISILFFQFTAHAQNADSVRTRNDKPGTPQSLRTPDQSPQSRVKIINNGAGVNQKTIVGGSESSRVNNTSGQTIITSPNNNNAVPKIPITLQTKPVNPADTIKNGVINKGVTNVTNPIRN